MAETVAGSGTKGWTRAGIALALVAVLGAAGFFGYQEHQRREAEKAATEARRQADELSITLVGRTAKALDTFNQGMTRSTGPSDVEALATAASAELMSVASDFGDPRLLARPGVNEAIRAHALTAEAFVRAFARYVQTMVATQESLTAARVGEAQAESQAKRALVLSVMAGHFGPLGELAAEERRTAQHAKDACEGMVRAAEARDALVAAATELAATTSRINSAVGGAVPSLALYDYAELAQRMASADVEAEVTAQVDEEAPQPAKATP
jgi:hypothetical protein